MQLFLHTRRPLHTSNPLLDVYFACRTTRPSSPGLVPTLPHALVHGCRDLWHARRGRNA